MINTLLMILFTIHAVYSIRNGVPIRLGETNYIASIQKVNIHYCSGIIIHDQYIITVAHIVAHLAVPQLRVVAGIISVNNHWVDRQPVKKVFFHPDFQQRNFIGQWGEQYFDHDIAVLKLEANLVWNPPISPVSLVDANHDWNCDSDCILISWNIPDDGRKPMILSWGWTTLMSHGVHQQWTNYLGENQRFLNEYFEAVAFGPEDVGSPLICGNSVTGLIIKGEQREVPGKPTIAMSIAPDIGFIDDIVNDGLFEIQMTDVPYVASIFYNETYVCGGFIVDSTHVATVGHCISGYMMAFFTVSVGYPPQSVFLVDVVIHPNYYVETTDIPPNWYIEHDFAVLTLAEPILLNEKALPLPGVLSDNFHEGQLCKLLRRAHHTDGETGVEFIKLMTSHVIIINKQCSQPQLDPSLQVPAFWGKSQYLIPIADDRDVGNPIICDGSPVGFLTQAIPFDEKTTAVLARFLEIRPYIEFWNSLGFHDVR